MNNVCFPLINLKLTINNIAFSVFGIDIYWYAILMVCAIVSGIIVAKIRDGLYNIKFDDILDLLIYLIPISIISARLYYVLFDLGYFANNPAQIFNFRTGGMAIYGGIIGGIVTSIIFCKKKNIKIINLLDYLAPALALGQSIGRWGNFINIEAYGTETTLPWRMGIFECGKYVEVHPTFLYESIATFILFIILVRIKEKRKFEGQVTYIYLIGYGFARMLIEGLRIDSLMLGTIRISQLVSFFILILGVVLYIKEKKKIKK